MKIRCIIDPIRVIKSLLRKTNLFIYNKFAYHRFRKIRRGKRDHCWCGSKLLHFKWHVNYGVCPICGTYVNKCPPLKEDLENFYSINLYWRIKQKSRGYPPLKKREALYRSDGRLHQWFRIIEQYGPNKGLVIEVGCAPGVLLLELSKRGYQCIGVEINNKVVDWIHRKTGLDIRLGFFPDMNLPPCNLFLALDVLEHNPSPEDFICEVSRCLLPDGVAIIQTAIDRYDYEVPFDERFDLFDDLEHLFLFTNKAMEMLAVKAGLEVISLKERIWLGGEICILKKP